MIEVQGDKYFKTITGEKFSNQFEAEQYETFIAEFGKVYEVREAGRELRYIVIVAERLHQELAMHFLAAGMGPMFEFVKGKENTAGNLKMRWGFREVSFDEIDTGKITDILGFHDQWNPQRQNPFKVVHSS